MRPVKFNKFERIAGLFVVMSVAGFVISMAGVAIKQGWFEKKIYWTTQFTSGDGVHPGTVVQIQGLKVGSVDSVELDKSNQVLVTFYVLKKFENKIRKDSEAQLIRPFVIGERILELSVGDEKQDPLPPLAMMRSVETLDLLTLLGGKELGSSLKAMSGMLENLKFLAQAFLDKDRTSAFINAFDRIEPLLKNLNVMSVEVIKLAKQATKDDQLALVMKQLSTTTQELNYLLPALNKESPHLARDVNTLLKNLGVLTEEFKLVVPALREVAPSLPKASHRALEALDEAVVLIKAMEKSFFVKGNAEEVRAEEAKREKQVSPNRLPANN